MLRKLVYFLAMCAYGVGAIGGLGYALYCKAYVIAVCVAMLAAIPTEVKLVKYLLR